MEYDVVIGLEVHCQLSAESKIFASDANVFGSEPNTNISVITLAHPGVLPKLNKKVVESAVKMGLACGSEINRFNYFDRKNYFYPDLPKGYQVSQDKFPVCVGGNIKIRLKEGKNFHEKTLDLHHIHLEEDAGKSVHDGADLYTLLDYNRAGTPLIEIVSEPCMQSPEEAGAYLSEIRKLVRFLEISDGNMEEGSLRADLNVSLKPKGNSKLGTKVEIKNMNSIRNLQRAAEYEIQRQATMLDAGEAIQQETRMFDADSGKTFSMRVKETMNDYRYFPEPDLAPVVITDEWLEEIRSAMPALPAALFEKFTTSLGIQEEHAAVLTEDRELSDFFMAACLETSNFKAASNWIVATLRGYANDKGTEFGQLGISPSRLAETIGLVDEGKISHSAAQSLLPAIISRPDSPVIQLASEAGLIQQQDGEALQGMIDEVIASHVDKVTQYKKGKKGLMGLFVGEVMKKSRGSADPKMVNELLIKALS